MRPRWQSICDRNYQILHTFSPLSLNLCVYLYVYAHAKEGTEMRWTMENWPLALMEHAEIKKKIRSECGLKGDGENQ